jgi:hypothetical protein
MITLADITRKTVLVNDNVSNSYALGQLVQKMDLKLETVTNSPPSIRFEFGRTKPCIARTRIR